MSSLRDIHFQYNENNQQYSTKIMKIQVLLRGLEEITKAFMVVFWHQEKTASYPTIKQND